MYSHVCAAGASSSSSSATSKPPTGKSNPAPVRPGGPVPPSKGVPLPGVGGGGRPSNRGEENGEEAVSAPATRVPPKGVPMFPGGAPKLAPKGTPNTTPIPHSNPPVQKPPAALPGVTKKPPPVVPKKGAASPASVGQAKALYPYNAQRDDELSFSAGDIINVINKQPEGMKDWYEGELNGARGYFPANYVEEIGGKALINVFVVCVTKE